MASGLERGATFSKKELTRLDVEGTYDHSCRMLMLLSDMASELDVINDRVAAIDAEVKALAKTGADMQQLMDIPDTGLVLRRHWSDFSPPLTTMARFFGAMRP